MPLLDKILIIILKILYIVFYFILRLSFRIAVGKKARDKLLRNKKRFSHFDYEFDIIPTFPLIGFLYSIIKFLRLGNPFLIKISVPKYDYKGYCPINRNDLINMTIREDEIIEHFCPKEGDIVVDVGAHYGRYTIISSKRVGINGKVIAIEAHPGNFDILNRNIQLNRLTNVVPLNYAVYSQRRKIKLYLPDEELGYTIYNTIMVNRADPRDNFVEVNADTLDNILQLNRIKQVNWVKIDVEGAELEVLKGAHNILSNSKDISVHIEIHGISHLYKPIIELLNLYNFKIEFEKTFEGYHRQNMKGGKNVLLRKSNSGR
jgi:FkbM family methyltransferase